MRLGEAGVRSRLDLYYSRISKTMPTLPSVHPEATASGIVTGPNSQERVVPVFRPGGCMLELCLNTITTKPKGHHDQS